jgi:hypothetical protein
MEQRAAKAGAGDMASWGATLWSHAVIRTRFFDDYLLEDGRNTPETGRVTGEVVQSACANYA